VLPNNIDIWNTAALKKSVGLVATTTIDEDEDPAMEAPNEELDKPVMPSCMPRMYG